ncbi:hypothetical protein Q9L42_019485 [Methylomarinum sp. Ch1-1]|uniref:UDP-N-acetylglucosamine kinase n=1 Tax=Methylomarinum roseum TaxID=3067653 RepID=A0AAU7NU38_9GAMM|nr:hypothetical protein [Methylomarinum sp. Ch1-1]MDP4519418.1 hypothetical protein [Methylomarinum sp. Ch1-1]
MQVFWIIAGPNGAGKTTFAMEYLPAVTHCKNVINADMIAVGVSPLAPDINRSLRVVFFLMRLNVVSTNVKTLLSKLRFREKLI